MVFKEFIFYNFLNRGCGGFERIDFEMFPLYKRVVVFPELVSFTVSILGVCGCPKRTDS